MFSRNFLMLAFQSFVLSAVPNAPAQGKKKGNDAVRNPAHSQSIGDALAGTGGLIPTIAQLADQEAAMIEDATNRRKDHWVNVFGLYKHDMPELETYPKAVRHAYARKLGLDMSLSRSKWEPSQRKLYDSFCANQVSPLNLMIALAKEKGAAVVINLLTGKGTIPQKVQQARLELGRPAKARGTKERDDEAAAEENESDATKSKSAGGKRTKKWDITDIQNKTPLEAVLVLIGGTLKTAELDKVVRAVVARYAQSADPLEKVYGEMLQAAADEFARKNDEDGEELEVDADPTAPIEATGTEG